VVIFNIGSGNRFDVSDAGSASIIRWKLCPLVHLLEVVSSGSLTGSCVQWFTYWKLCPVVHLLEVVSTGLLTGSCVQWFTYWKLCPVVHLLEVVSTGSLTGSCVHWFTYWKLCPLVHLLEVVSSGSLTGPDVLLDHLHPVGTTQYLCMTGGRSVSETCLHQK
jgi:ABC-type polysaccharide/polyol phosphate export permease